ncbi:hypothetical protein VcTj87_13950 [Vibrio comitans]
MASETTENTYRIPLTQQEQEWISQAPPIRYAANSDWEPFSFLRDGQVIGFSIDYLNLISERTGLHFQPVTDLSWDEYFKMAQEGELDLLHTVRKRNDISNFMSYSSPYFVGSASALYGLEGSEVISSIEEINDKSIAIINGFVDHIFLSENYPDLKLVPIENLQQGMKHVLDNTVDYFLCHPKFCDNYISRNYISGISNQGNLGLPALDAYNKGYMTISRDKPILLNIINKALATIGPVEQSLLNDKWLSRTATDNKADADTLTPEQVDWLQKNRRIAFAFSPGLPPFGFLDNNDQFAGLASDLVERFSRHYDVEVHLEKKQSFKDVLHALTSAEVEFIPGVNISPKRRKSMLFTDPFIEFNLGLYSRIDKPIASSLDALAGRKLGVINAGAMSGKLAAEYPEIDIYRYSSVADYLKALDRGEVDAVIGNPYMVEYFAKSEQINTLRKTGDTIYSFKFAVAVHPSQPELVSLFNKMLADMDEEQIEYILDRWMNIQFIEDDSWFKVSLAIASFALLLIITLLLVYLKNRRAALIQLTKAQSRLNEAQRVANIGHWSIDKDLTFSELSQQAANILGVSPYKPIAQEFYIQLIHPSDRSAYRSHWSSAKEKGVLHTEYRIIKDEQTIWVNEIAELKFDQSGNINGGSGTVQNISAFKEVQIQLEQRQQELQHLTTQLLNVQEEERKRVARELHDDLSQRLAVVAISIGSLRLKLRDPEIGDELKQVNESLVSIAEDTHSLSRRLHPSILDDLGLIDALQTEISSYEKREQIKVQFICSQQMKRVDTQLSLVVFRVVQEALRNIAKYAAASKVEVSLAILQQQLILQISDDGMGFDTVSAMKSPGLGLKSMSERASLVNGTFHIESAENQGTRIEIIVPLEDRPTALD